MATPTDPSSRRCNPDVLAHAASTIRLGTPFYVTARCDGFVRISLQGGRRTAISIDAFERLTASCDAAECEAFERQDKRLMRRRDAQVRLLGRRRDVCAPTSHHRPARARASHGSARRTRGSRRVTASSGGGSSGDSDPGGEPEPPRRPLRSLIAPAGRAA